jgi:hypothetical protein
MVTATVTGNFKSESGARYKYSLTLEKLKKIGHWTENTYQEGEMYGGVS